MNPLRLTFISVTIKRSKLNGGNVLYKINPRNVLRTINNGGMTNNRRLKNV
jgi:hypothetical protein